VSRQPVAMSGVRSFADSRSRVVPALLCQHLMHVVHHRLAIEVAVAFDTKGRCEEVCQWLLTPHTTPQRCGERLICGKHDVVWLLWCLWQVKCTAREQGHGTMDGHGLDCGQTTSSLELEH